MGTIGQVGAQLRAAVTGDGVRAARVGWTKSLKSNRMRPAKITSLWGLTCLETHADCERWLLRPPRHPREVFARCSLVF